MRGKTDGVWRNRCRGSPGGGEVSEPQKETSDGVRRVQGEGVMDGGGSSIRPPARPRTERSESREWDWEQRGFSLSAEVTLTNCKCVEENQCLRRQSGDDGAFTALLFRHGSI
uniref:Uncharacterized protein n=1 Tax=Knipowitschia caucasica TaxID=637954 RepID=A0AAV2K571_KNICA